MSCFVARQHWQLCSSWPELLHVFDNDSHSSSISEKSFVFSAGESAIFFIFLPVTRTATCRVILFLPWHYFLAKILTQNFENYFYWSRAPMCKIFVIAQHSFPNTHRANQVHATVASFSSFIIMRYSTEQGTFIVTCYIAKQTKFKSGKNIIRKRVQHQCP